MSDTSNPMRAAVLHRPAPAEASPLAIQMRSPSEPRPGEVRLAVRACGVCRTDLQLCEGDLAARRLPIVPGHQIVGTITKIGRGVADLAVGQRVGVSWIAGSCGTCRFCRSDRENLCAEANFTGWDRDGGFADEAIANAGFVYPLPHGYSDEAIAPLLCGGVIGYRCLRVAGAAAGMKIGLFGFGSSATTVLQLARHLGCQVSVVTRTEAEQARARALGADWTGGYDDTPPEPLDAAITFAPSGDVVIAALRTIDKGGVVVINAIHLDRIPSFNYDWLWWERSLRSVANLTRRDAIEFLEIAGEVPLVTHVDSYELADVNRALADLKTGNVRGSAVVRI
jgi:propanol-preferring alcohol dehydrogenase